MLEHPAPSTQHPAPSRARAAVYVNVPSVRVLMDYRPALRERSGVGEYAYQLARALLAAFPPDASGLPLDLTLFSSSWKDRLKGDPGLDGAHVVD